MKYEEALERIPKGTYRHYNGSVYEVIAIGENAETHEAMVWYFDINEPARNLACAADRFFDEKECTCKRFELVRRSLRP